MPTTGTYYRNGEKWEARGRVTTQNLRTGSTLTGPALDYFRVVKGVRDTLEMYSTGRPRIQYASRRRRRQARPSPTSSWRTGCA